MNLDIPKKKKCYSNIGTFRIYKDSSICPGIYTVLPHEIRLRQDLCTAVSTKNSASLV